MTDRLVGRPGSWCQALAAWCRAGTVRLGPRQLAAQHLAEQVVIAEPLPGLVQRHDEQVVPLQQVQDLRRVGRPGTAAPSGAQNRPSTDVRTRNCRTSGGWRLSTSSARKSSMNRLSPENWPMKACGDGMAAQRQRGQVHTGWPAFRPFHQVGQIRPNELNARYGVHQRGHVRGGGGARAAGSRAVAGGAQPAQPQRRIDPGGEHQLHRRRQVPSRKFSCWWQPRR